MTRAASSSDAAARCARCDSHALTPDAPTLEPNARPPDGYQRLVCGTCGHVHLEPNRSSAA